MLRELIRIAFSDVRTLLDESGVKPLGEWDDDAATAVSVIEVVTKNLSTGADTVHKIKLWDKLKALELLCRHLDLLRQGDAPAGVALQIVVDVSWALPPSSASRRHTAGIRGSRIARARCSSRATDLP